MNRSDSSIRQDQLYGAVRTALIGYGILAFTLLSGQMASAGSSSIDLLLWGVGVQVALVIARRLIMRLLAGEICAQALLLLELIGDAASVLLFAIATFSAVALHTQGI